MQKVLAKVGIFLLLVIVVFMFFMESLLTPLIFPVPKAGYIDDDSIIHLKTKTGLTISATYLENKNTDFVVLYSHGNGEDLFYAKPLNRLIYEAGYSVFAYDYAGYGTSEGSPSVKQTYVDIQAAYDYLVDQKKISPNNIIVYGRSLGGGPSGHLVANNQVGGLILESTFASLFSAKTPILGLPGDSYHNNKLLASIDVPILILHGEKDLVVGYWNAKILFDRANQPKKLVSFKEAGHNNIQIVAKEQYLGELIDFRKNF